MGSQYLFIYQTPVIWQAGALLGAGNRNLPEDTGIWRQKLDVFTPEHPAYDRACALCMGGLRKPQPNGRVNE